MVDILYINLYQNFFWYQFIYKISNLHQRFNMLENIIDFENKYLLDSSMYFQNLLDLICLTTLINDHSAAFIVLF